MSFNRVLLGAVLAGLVGSLAGGCADAGGEAGLDTDSDDLRIADLRRSFVGEWVNGYVVAPTAIDRLNLNANGTYTSRTYGTLPSGAAGWTLDSGAWEARVDANGSGEILLSSDSGPTIVYPFTGYQRRTGWSKATIVIGPQVTRDEVVVPGARSYNLHLWNR